MNGKDWPTASGYARFDRTNGNCKYVIFPYDNRTLTSLCDEKIVYCALCYLQQQKSPAIADKPARREGLPKIAPIRRAYNVVADNSGLSSFV